MHTIYNLLSGPMVWISLILCIGGCLYRLISMGLLARKKDSAVFVYMDAGFALRSILHWITPFASENSRQRPVMTVVTFLFHIGVIILPTFLFAHVVLWKESLDISWWYLSDGLSDALTLVVIAACLFFMGRRLVLPEVRYLTGPSDFLLPAGVALPFITGFWAYHQWPGHTWMMLLHMLSGEIMLVMIPFTRLSHMIFFPFTRGYMGSEFGGVRKARDW